MTTSISVNKVSVQDLLKSGKEHKFIIPEYQRPYAWGVEEAETLFNDLWDFTEKQESTYFLGSIVSYLNEQGEQEIIDGQQRITSLFLLLRAIYTNLQQPEEKTKEAMNFIQKIEPTIWIEDSISGDIDYSKILIESKVINNAGNEILRRILETGKADENATDNYSVNYRKFQELYNNKAQQNPMQIYYFILAVLSKAILLPITADTQDTALTIFSTLNDRGLPLSDADIFKAKIYNHLNSEEKNKFIEEWKELDENAQYAGETIQSLFYYYMFYLRAKSEDDKSTTPGITNDADRVSYMQYLFRLTKQKFKNDKLFDPNEIIKIRDHSFKQIVKELEKYNLSNTNDDVKGIAFEKFLGTTFRGELGQFFTPRALVDYMVELLDPEEGEVICDPCCGSGGFLIKAFEYVREKIEDDIKQQIDNIKKQFADNQSAYAMAIASSSRKMTCCLIMDINSLTCSKPFTLPLKRITSEVKVSVFSSFVAIVALLFC